MTYRSIFKEWIDNSGKKRFYFFLAHLLYNLFLFILSIVGAKTSGPEEWGIITLLLLLSTYSGLLTFGINNGLGIILPYKLGESKIKDAKKTQAVAFTSLFLSLFPIGLIQYLFIFLQGHDIILWFLLFGYTFSFQILTYFKVKLRSYENFGLFSLAYIMQTLSISFGVLGLIKGFNYLTVTSIANFLTAIFIWIQLPKSVYFELRFKTSYKLVKRGFPIMLAGIIGELLLSVDRILISIFFDDLQLGYYGLSANLFKGIRVIGIAISMIALPLIVKAFATKNYSAMLRYAKNQQWISALVMALSSLLLALFTYHFIPRFLPEYEKALVPGFILMVVASILPFGFYPNILNTIGKQKVYLSAQVFGIIMNLIFSSIFISLGYGINGVATGSCFAMFCYIMLLRYLGKNAVKKYLHDG